MMKILDGLISDLEGMPVFIRGLLIAFLLFIVSLVIKSFSLPDSNLMADIERTGRNATCVDLIGKWSFPGSSTTWEFTESGYFKERGNIFFSANFGGDYSCDDKSARAKIPIYDYQLDITFCCETIYLGKISTDGLIIFLGSDRNALVIIRK